MTEEFKKQIETEARQAVTELLAQTKLKKGDVFVVGCSSSEIVGGHIGKDSSLEAAQAVYAGVATGAGRNGIWLAAQCCEHLNRAIIIEREAAEKYGWEEVCVVPRPHAGGSWATTCWKQFKDPIAVEEIRAHAGIDIGGTLIGMHLRRVAVPVRLSLSKIGEANILCARTRPEAHRRRARKNIPRRTEPYGGKESGRDAGGCGGHPRKDGRSGPGSRPRPRRSAALCGLQDPHRRHRCCQRGSCHRCVRREPCAGALRQLRRRCLLRQASHFIGHLQTNKIKKVLGRASLIQSVDSEHLLAAIEKEAAKAGIVQASCWK